jgi:hypothetical protein
MQLAWNVRDKAGFDDAELLVPKTPGGSQAGADAEQWWTHHRDAHQAGTFRCAFTALIVAGIKS